MEIPGLTSHLLSHLVLTGSLFLYFPFSKSGLLRYHSFIGSKIHPFEVYSSINVNECVQSCNHHHNQDIESFPLPQMFILPFAVSPPPLTYSPRQPLLHFLSRSFRLSQNIT